MTLDGGWGLIIATVVGVLLVWIGNLAAGHFSNTKEKGDGAHERIDSQSERLDMLERDFLKYQTVAANEFARLSGVERMETNIFAALNRLEAKVDKLQDRGTHHG